MEEIKDILNRRAETIGMRQNNVMDIIKEVITNQLHVEVRVLKLKHNVAQITTEDAAAAGEIRLSKNHLIQLINKNIPDHQDALRDITILIR